MLTERQEKILRLAVEAYLETGSPVGSKSIAEGDDVAWGASTVRHELAELEREGYLTHPHTSAGRLPTDAGYRLYADLLLQVGGPAGKGPVAPELELSRVRQEVNEALRETTAALAQANDLLALVTAPQVSTATIHRIEVLLLQPRVVAVVAIASTGDVSKRVFTFPSPVDPGLVDWASSFLNERLAGSSLGARSFLSKLEDPELGHSERTFLEAIGHGLVELGEQGPERLYMDGTARLLSESHAADIPEPEGVVRALEGRVSVLSVLRSALREQSVFLCIGSENPEPALHSVTVVGASYGLGYRQLGAVGVVGPLRMDYGRAIDSVRDAAGELSRFFATVYEG
ncbi:MAG: heat-inducible transcription repressor HrcA [Thermoleophilia bacterium]|jgi:heat-inducible transcriptional repressor|nr:heat-inducible transcription repressor HrcA [Thermoleophilia bacterium]